MNLAEELKTLAAEPGIKIIPSRSGRDSRCPGCGTVKAVLTGLGKATYNRLLGKKPPRWAVQRLTVCLTCPDHTWLNWAQWLAYTLIRRRLPVRQKRRWLDHLWCCDCRCRLTWKMLVWNAKCLLNKWPEPLLEKQSNATK